jgi:Xaa-Pro dipeptidase
MKFSRRSFAGLAAGTAASLALRFSAESKSTEQAPTGLPPSIANLKSRKSEAVPISAEEMRTRVDRARQLMAANQLEAIFVSSGNSLPYFSAVQWWQSERLFAMVLLPRASRFSCARHSKRAGPGNNWPMAPSAPTLTFASGRRMKTLIAG